MTTATGAFANCAKFIFDTPAYTCYAALDSDCPSGYKSATYYPTATDDYTGTPAKTCVPEADFSTLGCT